MSLPSSAFHRVHFIMCIPSCDRRRKEEVNEDGGGYCDGVEAWCMSEGLHSARPRVMRREAVAIDWLGSDTDYG